MASDERALDRFAASFGRHINNDLDGVMQDVACRYGCESPIESLFLSALEVVCALNHICVFCIERQHPIDSYRVDFFIEAAEKHYCNGCSPRRFGASVIVDCDGHDFHEKTKEQASRDKQRDRKLQSMGHTVFRFTGSDVWNDPFKCAAEAVDYLERSILAQMGWNAPGGVEEVSTVTAHEGVE